MIVSRTPFRITLGGGGTDLPSYYENHGGFQICGLVSRGDSKVELNTKLKVDYLSVTNKTIAGTIWSFCLYFWVNKWTLGAYY